MIIYLVKNNINGKCYVGQTSQELNRRRNHHLRSAEINRYGTHFHRALKKYEAKNFSWYILDACDNKDVLNKLEKDYIKMFNSFENGYNMTSGGLGHNGLSGSLHPMYGKHRSKHTKEKLSMINKGKVLSDITKEKIGLSSKGRTMPVSARKKISKAVKGRKLSKETIEKIRLKTSGENHHCFGKKLPKKWRENAALAQSSPWLIGFPDGKYKIVKGLNKFCRENFLSSTSMQRVANGVKKEHRGFKCKRLFEFTIYRVGKENMEKFVEVLSDNN
jgi:group I intron endonuclease